MTIHYYQPIARRESRRATAWRILDAACERHSALRTEESKAEFEAAARAYSAAIKEEREQEAAR